MVRLKDSGTQSNKIPVIKFQFLMVRLKEKHKNHKKTEEIISIPYGAIKRNKK